MNQLTDDQKFQVLLSQLSERYNAAHKIRERSTQFTLWLSGMAIGLAWLLLSQGPLPQSQRVALTFLVLALFAGGLYFIVGLARGFRANQQTMIRLESALHLHESGAYLPKSSLLPAEYNQTNRKWSHHFVTLYVWLAVTTLSLLFLIWTRPGVEKKIPEPTKIEESKGGK